VFGFVAPQRSQLNLNELDLDLPLILSVIRSREIEAPFSRDEVKKIVLDMPSDCAPGTNGFSRLFLKLCWDTIMDDLLDALDHLHKIQFNNLRRLNCSILIMLLKKQIKHF
jgi:hypothetical protein